MVKIDLSKVRNFFFKTDQLEPVNNKRFDENWRKEFEQRIKFGAPFIATSVIAWPAYWLYRGFEWSKHKKTEALPSYIQKTFYQAKVMQFAIISTGLIVAMNIPKIATPIPTLNSKISNKQPKLKNNYEEDDIKEIDVRELGSTKEQKEEQFAKVEHGQFSNDEDESEQ